MGIYQVMNLFEEGTTLYFAIEIKNNHKYLKIHNSYQVPSE